MIFFNQSALMDLQFRKAMISPAYRRISLEKTSREDT